MAKILSKFSLIASIAFLGVLIFNPELAAAQWPPFRFVINPAYQNGKITYNITFSNRADWSMTDVTITMSIPEGTRFLEASAQSNTQATFDGKEVTFFTSTFHRPIRNASFVVEVTDPALTVFTTHAWIAWKGDEPGNYVTDENSFDITRPPLVWEPPAASRLRLDLNALVTGDTVTYYVYPTNVSSVRMWDLKINVPIPEGSTFVSAEAPPRFAASFTGQEVSFFISELERGVKAGPLSFKVALAGMPPSLLTTHAWAAWKNVGSRVGRTIPPQEEMVSGDVIVQPYTLQHVYAEVRGDVPFANYDLISVALGLEGSALKVIFYTDDYLGPASTALQFHLFIDKDCRADSGEQAGGMGRDYSIRYRHHRNRADLGTWDEEQKKWNWQRLDFSSPADQKMVALTIPSNLLEDSSQFCWQALARNLSKEFSSPLPNDRTAILTYNKMALTETTPVTTPVGFAANTSGPGITSTQIITPSVTSTMGGKLAVPLDSGWATYNIHIFSMPAGLEIMQIANARQPNFRLDGQRLLVNHEGGGIENVFEYNLLDGTNRQVGDGPKDSHPYYDVGGNRVAFDNPELIIGAKGIRQPFIFVQCGLMPPHLETEPRCRDIPSLGVLVPAGQMGEIQGTHPVWTSTDMIAYKGCNTWAGARLCGIYVVPSTSTKGFSDGFIPQQLTSDTSDIPADTKGNFIAFTSQRDGNWEAYIMDLNGNGVKNLSNSPEANDGLPTISPDGNWVAFVSDRGGLWAVWAVPVTGGDPQKLFDLPAAQPWGDGDRSWTNERISWGP